MFKVGDKVLVTQYPCGLTADDFVNHQNPVGCTGIVQDRYRPNYVSVLVHGLVLSYYSHTVVEPTEVNILAYKLGAYDNVTTINNS